MKWLINLLFGKDEDSYYEECIRRDAEIRDIRRRIEEQRNLLSSPRSFHVERHEEMAQPKQVVEQASERERKNAELDAIKAKLMGRKA